MLLLAVQVFEREPVHRQIGAAGHPCLDGWQRDFQQLRIEPGAGLTRLREQNLDLLPLRIDLVVALILVVLQRREIPHLVGKLSDVVGQLHGGEQLLRTLRQRPLQRGIRGNLLFQFRVRRPPGRPIGKDVGQVPLESIGNVLAIPQLWCRPCLGRRKQTHPQIIAHLLRRDSCSVDR